jgi:hypothetical protein
MSRESLHDGILGGGLLRCRGRGGLERGLGGGDDLERVLTRLASVVDAQLGRSCKRASLLAGGSDWPDGPDRVVESLLLLDQVRPE